MVQGLLYLGLSLWNEEDLMPVHGLGSLQGLSPLYQFKVKSQALCVIGTSLAPYDKCLHQSLSILVSLCINCKSLLHARFLLHFRRFCPPTLGVLIFHLGSSCFIPEVARSPEIRPRDRENFLYPLCIV